MGKKEQKKKPKAAFAIKSQKTPRLPNFPDPMRQHPSWRVSRMELADPYGWHVLDRDTLSMIRERLRNLEALTWHEILVRDNYWNHEYEISRLGEDALRRLRELGQDDTDFIVSLRLGNFERVWGFRDNEILNLLWWDPNHQVYPV
ncbi:MAG: hypothetical protein AABN34_24020 [Acidobacteriota bacterium]